MKKLHIYQLFFVLLIFSGSISSCKNKKDAVGPVKYPVEDAFRKTFHEAIREKMRGNYDIAIALFEKCLTINQESDATHYALSDLYEVQGKKESSMQHAESAFALDEENRWYALRLADLYYKSGNYHRSASFFEKVIEDEKNIDIKFKYAETLIHSNNYKGAISILDEIEVEMGKSPNLSLTKHDLYLELGDEAGANRELQELIDDNPSNIENMLVIADYFLRTNQEVAAKEILMSALEKNPNSGEIYLMLADINLREEKLDESFINLEKGFAFNDVSIARKIDLIRSLQPYAFEPTEDAKKIEKGLEKLFGFIYDESLKNDTLHMAYGYFLRDQGKTDKAIEQFKFSTEINSNNYNVWLQLLYLQYDTDSYKGMYEDGRKAVELFPAQPIVYLLSGIAAYEQKEFASSEEWLYLGKDLIINDPPLVAEFLHQLGRCSCLQKDFKKGYEYLDQSRKMDQFNGNVYSTKAMCLLGEGKKKEAIAEVELALKESPDNSFFLDAMGMIYLKSKDFEKAKLYFEKAYAFEPENAELNEHLGDVYFNLGEVDKAINYWQIAKDFGRNADVLNRKLTDKTYYAD